MIFKHFNPILEYENLLEDDLSPWAGHKYFIYDFIRNFKPKIIVELGTYKGTSIFSMAQAVKDEKLKTKLYAIDTWQGDHQSGFYDRKILNGVKKIIKRYYKLTYINLIQEDFDKALKSFKKQNIDLLHIDGLHTYKAVKHDFENWTPLVSKNGMIILHDISVTKDDFGVYKLWKELKQKYKNWEFVHSNGLGIIFKNKQPKIMLKNDNIWPIYYDSIYRKNILQLEKKIIEKNLSDITRQLSKAKRQLSTIYSSKPYRLWKKYNQIKILFNKNK